MEFKDFIGEKKLSVGLILTDGEVLLAVQPTGHDIYDIPKGEVDPGEALIQTLVREIREETGFNISKYTNRLLDMGQFLYMSHKDVHVYVLILDDLPPAEKMRCVSTFKIYGRDIPEVKNHRYVSFDDLHIFNPHMARIIHKVRGKIKNEI
jgi:8-oxo-dGTP pyrophosphatase MutT (NUDIX family)